MSRISELNLFVCLLLAASLAMTVPAILAWRDGALVVAQSFLVAGLVSFVLAGMLALIFLDRVPALHPRAHIVTVLSGYVVLPLICAVPVYDVLEDISFAEAYFEMVSALTTTGMSGYDWANAPDAVAFWRIFVGWLGGFMILLAGFAIMAPLQLGGFEVESTTYGRIGLGATHLHGDSARGAGQMWRSVEVIGPIYVGATLVLAAILGLLGDAPYVAFSHAMAILSTSGMSMTDGPQGASSGLFGEMAMILFLGFAISHRLLSDQWRRGSHLPLRADMELRLAVTLVVVLAATLFFWNVISIYRAGGDVLPLAALRMLWSMVFTTISYLTTTGFESRYLVSEMDAPQLLLMSLVIIGGGIATTAGGVKLLRVFALYKHGMREMERLVHPSSVGGYGAIARSVRREGAYIAWMFVMIFFLSIGLGMLALGLMGFDLEDALILTVAALATCGPLAADVIPAHEMLEGETRVILNVLMILGRLEALAVIAILNPEYWRR